MLVLGRWSTTRRIRSLTNIKGKVHLMGKDAKAFFCFHPLLFHHHSSPATLALPWLSSVNDVANQTQVLRLVLEFIPRHPIEYLCFCLGLA